MNDKRHELIDGDVEKALVMLRDVPIPDVKRVAAKRAWLLTQTAKYRKTSTPRHIGLWKTYRIRRPMMANLLLAIAVVVTVLAGGSGIVYAADTAAPGDPLWDLDQEIEAIQLRLTGRAWKKTELLLSIAEERLEEAERLVGVENAPNRKAALTSYGATVSTLARTIAGNKGLDNEELTVLVDTAVSGHETQLSQILDDNEGENDEGNPCDGEFTHPAAKRLADKYSVEYEVVIGWFCDGYGIGEIMLAFETVGVTGEDPGSLLTQKTEAGGWGKVWQDRGIIGKPDDAGPPDNRPGKPDDAPGKPDDVGPPDDRPGKPDDAPGKPDDGEDEEGENNPCDGDFTHPAVNSLAEKYDVDYESVIDWFCDGYGIGDIKLALETAEVSGEAPGDLLAQKTKLGGWGAVWQELDLIGKPDKASPPEDVPGKPDGQD